MGIPSLSIQVRTGLLVLPLAVLIAGLPLGCLASAGHQSPVVLAEVEDAVSGECVADQLDASAWSFLCFEIQLPAPRTYVYRVADELVTDEAAYRESHPQRGPPA